MRPSLRFLTLAILGWAGLRAATLGTIPGASLFAIPPSEAKSPPPIPPTQFPPIAPPEGVAIDPALYGYAPSPAGYGYAPGSAAYGYAPDGTPVMPVAAGPAYARPLVVPVYYQYRSLPAPPVRPASYTPLMPEPGPLIDPSAPVPDEWPYSRLAATSVPAPRPQSSPLPTRSVPATFAAANRLDRVQLAMWAMLRSRQTLVAGPTSLASGGTLGASQAGARLFYNVSPQVAAVLRTSSDVGRRGGEVAIGARVQPLRSIPVWITAERRQALGRYGGGRNAFAFFAEGGIYDQPLPLGFLLDGYAQGGIVGLHSRDLFIDGAATFTRPVYRQFSAGFGVWGGAQPGLYRIDAGPRVTMKVRRNVRAHLDWRQRLAGNAEPGSGPALTLAGDF